MMEIAKLIESEIGDFFAGFGHPGDPETTEEMQSQLLARVMPLLAGLEQEPVAWVMKDDLADIDVISTPAYPALSDAVSKTVGDLIPLYAAPQLQQPAVPECYQRLLHHAYGMTMGHDWNKGTMAGHHREKLCKAVDDCRAAMLQGAEPEQGWIPCGERMPEEIGRYWCYVEEQNSLGKSHYQWNCSWNGDRWWVESENGGRVTHWMPLPAAPQQEADNG